MRAEAEAILCDAFPAPPPPPVAYRQETRIRQRQAKLISEGIDPSVFTFTGKCAPLLSPNTQDKCLRTKMLWRFFQLPSIPVTATGVMGVRREYDTMGKRHLRCSKLSFGARAPFLGSEPTQPTVWPVVEQPRARGIERTPCALLPLSTVRGTFVSFVVCGRVHAPHRTAPHRMDVPCFGLVLRPASLCIKCPPDAIKSAALLRPRVTSPAQTTRSTPAA